MSACITDDKFLLAMQFNQEALVFYGQAGARIFPFRKIGDWSDSLTTDLMADRIRLEVGVLLVAIGSVVLSAVLTYLMPKFRN